MADADLAEGLGTTCVVVAATRPSASADVVSITVGNTVVVVVDDVVLCIENSGGDGAGGTINAWHAAIPLAAASLHRPFGHAPSQSR